MIGSPVHRPALSAAAAALVLSACAQRPEAIQAQPVSPLLYQHLTCTQLEGEANRVLTRLEEITGRQREQANLDAAGMAIGLFVLWPMLLFTGSGPDHASEIGRLRGEAEAIDAAGTAKGCAPRRAAAAT